MTEPVLDFAQVVRRLRAECPWKAAQTHRSLVRYLLEETHETVEAIEVSDDSGDPAPLREELGDLLLQVFLHTAIAEQAGAFTLDDVAREVTAKMVRRNPHVLGAQASAPASLSAAEVDDAWQAIKAQEKPRASVTDGLPPSLPALLLAEKVLGRLDRLDRLDPAEMAPVVRRDGARRAVPAPAEQDIGDRLLALVAESREAEVDPEQALRAAVRRMAAGR